MNNLWYSDRYLKLIGSLRCLNEAKTIDMILGKRKLQKLVFFIFSNICCWYTLELPNEAIPMCTYNIYLFKSFFTISSKLLIVSVK